MAAPEAPAVPIRPVYKGVDPMPEFATPADAYAALIPLAERDPQRPRYHFLPPAGWMNDPNGTVFHAGQYHLCYQHNPYSGVWVMAQMHWGHAASRDLVHWTHLPIALTPTDPGPDHEGIWSGSVVMDGEVAHAFYTGARPELQCLATSTDGLLTWENHTGNPVIAAPPEGLEVAGFRDPHVWREANGWYMVVGSGFAGAGAALLYRSGNLTDWEYLGPLLAGGNPETGAMWECPDFFPLGDRHVLLIFATGFTWYVVGDWTGGVFTPERWGKLDWGPSFLAARTLIDDEGRRIIFGWDGEMRPEEALEAAGWGGVMSLPRVLSLNERGEVVAEPAPELQALRGERHEASADLAAGQTVALREIAGDCLELSAEIESAGEVAVLVRRSPGGEEETAIRWDPAAGTVSLDLEGSSLDPAVVWRGVYPAPVHVAPGEPLRLRVFVDRSLVEVFAQGRVCLTGRMYPTRADSLGVALCSQESATVEVEAWGMSL